jgi:hypothetical protein
MKWILAGGSAVAIVLVALAFASHSDRASERSVSGRSWQDHVAKKGKGSIPAPTSRQASTPPTPIDETSEGTVTKLVFHSALPLSKTKALLIQINQPVVSIEQTAPTVGGFNYDDGLPAQAAIARYESALRTLGLPPKDVRIESVEIAGTVSIRLPVGTESYSRR